MTEHRVTICAIGGEGTARRSYAEVVRQSELLDSALTSAKNAIKYKLQGTVLPDGLTDFELVISTSKVITTSGTTDTLNATWNPDTCELTIHEED